MAIHGFVHIPEPGNEPILDYAPGSPERAELAARIASMAAERMEAPCIINGEEVRTGDVFVVRAPHQHDLQLADVHAAGEKEVAQAIDAAVAVQHDWSRMPFEDRAAIFLRAADLIAGEQRATLNAATIVGQSKSVFQSEIDAARKRALVEVEPREAVQRVHVGGDTYRETRIGQLLLVPEVVDGRTGRRGRAWTPGVVGVGQSQANTGTPDRPRTPHVCSRRQDLRVDQLDLVEHLDDRRDQKHGVVVALGRCDPRERARVGGRPLGERGRLRVARRCAQHHQSGRGGGEELVRQP